MSDTTTFLLAFILPLSILTLIIWAMVDTKIQILLAQPFGGRALKVFERRAGTYEYPYWLDPIPENFWTAFEYVEEHHARQINGWYRFGGYKWEHSVRNIVKFDPKHDTFEKTFIEAIMNRYEADMAVEKTIQT